MNGGILQDLTTLPTRTDSGQILCVKYRHAANLLLLSLDRHATKICVIVQQSLAAANHDYARKSEVWTSVSIGMQRSFCTTSSLLGQSS